MRLPPPRFFVLLLLLSGHVLLGWHALYGKRSLAYQAEVRQRLARIREAYADAQARRAELERKVAHLRDETLDPDTLDEEARRQLGFVRSDEILALPTPEGKNSH